MSKANIMKRSIFAIISLLIVYAICFNFLDLQWAIYFHYRYADTPVQQFCTVIGLILKPTYWLVLAVIATVIGFILKNKEGNTGRSLLFFGLSLIVAYIICGVIKVVLGRYRPIEFFEHAKYGFHWLSLKHNSMSSPSGHATMAYAGLFALTKIIKCRWATIVLLLIATLIALSRLIAGAHYASDVIFGAYVGLLSVYWVQSLMTTK